MSWMYVTRAEQGPIVSPPVPWHRQYHQELEGSIYQAPVALSKGCRGTPVLAAIQCSTHQSTEALQSLASVL